MFTKQLAAALVICLVGTGGVVATPPTAIAQTPESTKAELQVQMQVVLGEIAELQAMIDRLPDAPPTTTTTTVAPTTTTTTIAPTTTTTAAPARFNTLPRGAALPSDSQCATQVALRSTSEVRPNNATRNNTRGRQITGGPFPLANRVTGDYVGNTEQILLWGACKWGIDEDIVFAKAVTESFWRDSTNGDGGESWGLMQVREPYWGWSFPEARTSNAMNVDVALSAQRSCFEGNETWLNGFPRGQDYAGGDMMGCVGLWFTGRWYAPQPGFNDYVNTVQGHINSRTWTTTSFRNAT